MGICDQEVVNVLTNLVQPPDVHNIELDRTAVICSTRVGEVNEYVALDTDHHGHPLREADRDRIQRYWERLPDRLMLKVGARVILRRNMDTKGGWVNDTLAVITSMHPNCVVIAN